MYMRVLKGKTMSCERQKVLVVDDETSNLKILSQILREEVDVLLAKDGKQAIRKANQFKPDLILLDVIMPDMDGFEVIRQLKSSPTTNLIPVIFVTGEIDTNDEERGLELGASDYIQKPFQASILKARVRLNLKLTKQRAMLEQLSNIDPLTSIANRRRYAEVLDVEWKSAVRHHTALSLIMIDIDYFKRYNDHYGHAAGDRALEKVANVLANQALRPRDFVARYGGEEFVLILPNTDYKGTVNIMEACRKAVAELEIEHIENEDQKIMTISAGGYNCLPNSQDTEQDFREAALKIADDMLYKSKQNGRNCVTCYQLDVRSPKNLYTKRSI